MPAIPASLVALILKGTVANQIPIPVGFSAGGISSFVTTAGQTISGAALGSSTTGGSAAAGAAAGAAAATGGVSAATVGLVAAGGAAAATGVAVASSSGDSSDSPTPATTTTTTTTTSVPAVTTPDLSGTWVGTGADGGFYNLPGCTFEYDLYMEINQSDDRLSGGLRTVLRALTPPNCSPDEVIGEETNYSLTGTVTGNDLQMSLRSDEEEIDATGSVSGNRISGDFISHSEDGVFPGRWSVVRQ
jgi:hypothetical protein